MAFKKEARATVKDPVCGMEIETATAYDKIEHAGRTFYFCSKHCKEEFEKNPKKYSKKS
ncbi:MAG: YHS domain-containing protein [Candidatus Bathyarchaeota archaeon]|nr:YHS domain-containing protein [Candidatus Bathyarchaeota archaeon]